MSRTRASATSGLSQENRTSIERAVIDAATGHLRAPDADTALRYYLPDAVVAGDGRLFESFQEFEEDVHKFYRTLQEVQAAEWIDPRVDVLAEGVAVFTARVHWESTDANGERLNLDGVWTAVWLGRPEGWRIAIRHESFE